MPTTLDRAESNTSISAAQWLRETTAAVRVSFTWLGVRKTLTSEQKHQAAESFGADGQFLSAGKKILDTRHPVYKEVTAVRGKVLGYWKLMSLPFPEPGVRLIRQHEVPDFNERMAGFRAELEEAVAKLDDHYVELKSAARRRLGDLYNAADYPQSLRGLFGVEWDFPNVEPPDYLLQLNPEVYEQEKKRVSTRFEEAVRLTEEAFLGELARLVEHLTERLAGSEQGERKVFRDSAVTNLTEFFERFRQLNVRSSAELDALVDQAQKIVQGVEPQVLRSHGELRQQVATQLSRVQAAIDGMLVDQPRRRIIRAASREGGTHAAAD